MADSRDTSKLLFSILSIAVSLGWLRDWPHEDRDARAASRQESSLQQSFFACVNVTVLLSAGSRSVSVPHSWHQDTTPMLGCARRSHPSMLHGASLNRNCRRWARANKAGETWADSCSRERREPGQAQHCTKALPSPRARRAGKHGTQELNTCRAYLAPAYIPQSCLRVLYCSSQ